LTRTFVDLLTAKPPNFRNNQTPRDNDNSLIRGSQILRNVNSRERLSRTCLIVARVHQNLLFPFFFSLFVFFLLFHAIVQADEQKCTIEKSHRTALTTDRICERNRGRGTMGEGEACRSAGVIEPRRVQRDRRSMADPIGRADHVIQRSRCSRRGRRRHECTSRSRFSMSICSEVVCFLYLARSSNSF